MIYYCGIFSPDNVCFALHVHVIHSATLCLKNVFVIVRSYACALPYLPLPYFPTIVGCVVCPDPVLALKSAVKYKTARLGMLCSKLFSLS